MQLLMLFEARGMDTQNGDVGGVRLEGERVSNGLWPVGPDSRVLRLQNKSTMIHCHGVYGVVMAPRNTDMLSYHITFLETQAYLASTVKSRRVSVLGRFSS